MIFPYLLEHLLTCRPKEVVQYAGSTMCAVRRAMVIYTGDGEMILGLAVDAGEKLEDDFLGRMMEYLQSDVGYIADLNTNSRYFRL